MSNISTWDLFLQRLQSKTYRAALIGAILTMIELNSGFITQYIPIEYKQYIVLLWPVIMITLREFTNTALSEK